jgi:hypothetical protein
MELYPVPMYDDDGRPIPAFRPPMNDEKRLREVGQAASIFAEAHASDPFAYGRATLYMKRGLEYPSDVKAEGERLTRDRRSRSGADSIPG